MIAKVWNRSWDLAVRAPAFKRWIVRQWYEYFSTLDRDGEIECMNFGYADDDAPRLTLLPQDEPQRFPLQMYHHLATQIDVRELDILEVGSGRGGGASYITRYLRPRTYTSIELAHRAVKFCQTHYQIPGLNFFQGDAEKIEFPDATFDVVVNVESSTHYGNIQKFFNETRRVLRPDGFLLYADTWYPHQIPMLHQQFTNAGLTLVKSHDLIPRVARAMELDDARKVALMHKYTPKFLHSAIVEFSGMRGSANYEQFRAGEVQYVCCVLQNQTPPRHAPESRVEQGEPMQVLELA